MEEPPDSRTDDEPDYSTLNSSASRRSTSRKSTPGRSTSALSTSGRSTPGRSTPGRSTPGRSTPDKSTTPEPPPVPPATYHWEEVRKKRSVGGYPWTHLNKPPFDEKTFVKYQRDHVYEPVTPAASMDRISSSAKQTSKDESRLVIRIPLTEELVMADDTGSEPEDEQRMSEENEDEDEENDDEEDDDDDGKKPQQVTDESIYEGENENSSVGEAMDTGNGGATRIKLFQQKVKVKADTLRAKLQGVTKRKPKQKIVVDGENGEKSRRKFGQFATLPKKFTFNASKVNFSNAFNRNAPRNTAAADADQSGGSTAEETKTGRFSLPRFGFSKTSSESPKPSKSAKMGASRLSIPSLRSRTWSDASKVSKPDSPKTRFMDFGTYPRIFSKRGKTAESANKSKTPPPPQPPATMASRAYDSPEPQGKPRKNSFRRRFFRSHKESTPAPTEEQTATLAVEEELDESHVSKESLAEFGDSDLQEVISLNDDCRPKNGIKSVSEHRAAGVIEEIDSDEFFLREKGLSRGDVHISNYLSSEIRDVFRSNRTRSVEGDDNNVDNNDNRGDGTGTPARPSRTNSLRRPGRGPNAATDNAPADRFSTMPKSFGGTRPKPEHDVPPENIITSQTFEPSASGATLPSAFRAPWRTAQRDSVVAHMPPKPPSRLRMSKFSTFDTRSMIDLSRKRSQSQSGFLPSMNFSETVPKAPLRRSRTSLAGSVRDVSLPSEGRQQWLAGAESSGGGDEMPKPPLRRSRTSLAGSDRDISLHTSEGRPSWLAGGSGMPTPPLRRSRMSLTTDVDIEERSRPSAVGTAAVTTTTTRETPPRPPPPTVTPGYATVDKSSSLLIPPQSPVRHRRKKSYDVIKSQEFGAFFTIPRSYCYNRKQPADDREQTLPATGKLPPPSRPARAYNTLGPSRPLRRRLPIREHEYGDLAEDVGSGSATPPTRSAGSATDQHAYDVGEEEGDDAGMKNHRSTGTRSSSPDEVGDGGGPTATKVLYSGDVIEKMKIRPLPSPPPPPRKSKPPNYESPDLLSHRRRNTDSALVPFLDRRETSVTSSNNDDFFADVSRALLASAAKTTNATADDVSVGVQTDPLPDGYELDDVGSCCSVGSGGPASRASSTAVADRPVSRAADRPTSRLSTATEYADRPTSRNSAAAMENGYAIMPADMTTAGGPVMCAQRISVNELRVGKIIVADARSQRVLGIGDDESQSVQKAALQLRAACDGPALQPQLQDDAASVQSSRVSSMYPEVDSDEDRASVLAAPTPPRRRSRPAAGRGDHRPARSTSRSDDAAPAAAAATVDLSVAAADPSITELSCQLFRLCHSNVCSLFNKVVQQVVPEDTEKRRDLQAALCFLSIILAGLLILGFGNEKTVHHHHWDFQFPPANQ